MQTNILLLIKSLTQKLEQLHEPEHASTVAWWFLEGVTKKKKVHLLMGPFDISPQQLEQLDRWVERHVQDQYPLQYLLGSVPFGPLELLVQPPTLIPRPETEEWCCGLLARLQVLREKPIRILDLCTGSGCLALAVAHALPHAHVVGIDISSEAVALAQKNAHHNNIKNVQFVQSDLFTMVATQEPFDIIIANPPYINPAVWHELSPMVTRYEDPIALVAHNAGLEIIQKIVARAGSYLSKHSVVAVHGLPKLIVEIGYDQGEVVKKLFIQAGFDRVRVVPDSGQKDRIVIGW